MHHAVHLATLRERCAKEPLKIISKYSLAAAAALCGSISSKNDVSSSEVGAAVLAFDDIDKVGDKLNLLEAREIFEDLVLAKGTISDQSSNDGGAYVAKG